MSKVMYAFSGDPITLGHIDIIKRASEVFKDLIVAIGNNPRKKYLFSLEEREKLARESLLELPNIKVISFKGLLIDYAYENKIPVIIRGIRNSEDLSYELLLHQIGESQTKGIDTIWFPAKQNLTHVSSEAAKALQLEQGFTHNFVTLNVKKELEVRISNQMILSITGEVGMGKSFISKKFKTISESLGIQTHIIEVDRIGHEILENLTESIYVETRKKIIQHFGKDVESENGFINRKNLGKIIFTDLNELNIFNNLLIEPIILKIRREIYGKTGLFILDSALVSETNMLFLSNNHVLLVNSSKDIQEKRLLSRNYSKEQIELRLKSQFSQNQKKNLIQEKISKDQYGKLWEFENNSELINDDLENLVNAILNKLR